MFRSKSPDDSFGIRLFSEGDFTAGPAAQRRVEAQGVGCRRRCRQSDDDRRGGRLRGISAERDRSGCAADLRKGFGGHDGLVGSIGADRSGATATAMCFSIGPRRRCSPMPRLPAKPISAWTARPRSRHGLPAYRAGRRRSCRRPRRSGLSYQFSPRFGMPSAIARYERLVGDAGGCRRSSAKLGVAKPAVGAESGSATPSSVKR